LTATPQIAFKHAREAVARRGGQEIVIQCPTPSALVVDWDVDNQLVKSKRVPSTNGMFLTQEAGLFATPPPDLSRRPHGLRAVRHQSVFRLAGHTLRVTRHSVGSAMADARHERVTP
jgi:hypothetical protein